MKKIYNYLYLFILLYQPPIAKYNILHFLAIIAWFHIIKEERNYLKKELIIDILFFLSINTYLIIIILLNNNNYNILYSKIIIMLEIIPCCYYISKEFKKSEILNNIKNITLFQGILSILIFIFPQIKALQFLLYYNLGYNEQYLNNLTFRLNGFSTFLYYTTPIFQAMFAAYVLLYENNIIKKILYFIILLVSAIINSRTSIIILFLSIIAFSKRRIKFNNYFAILISVILIIIVINDINIAEMNKKTFEWIISGLNEINEFLKGKNIGYFAALKNYIEMKPISKLNVINIIFGTGKYIMGGKNGVYSDIGFQNDIYLGGILYSILIWTYFIFKLFKINLHKEYNNIGILLLFLMIISNIKGIIIENNEIIILIYILYYSSISEKKYELC